MSPASTRSTLAVRPLNLVQNVLGWGVAIPTIYFGIQLAAAPFHPGYSFFSRDASALGSSVSTAPWVFHLGILLLAVIEWRLRAHSSSPCRAWASVAASRV